MVVSDELTKREFEIFSLCAKGFKDDEIAEMLGISKATVTRVYSEIRQKLQVTTMPEAVFEAFHMKIFEVDEPTEPKKRTPIQRLPIRLIQVVNLTLDGYTDDEISEALGMNRHTLAMCKRLICMRTYSRNLFQAIARLYGIRPHDEQEMRTRDDEGED